MNTEELVKLLAADLAPVAPHATARRFTQAMAAGAGVSVLMMLLLFGVRPDIEQAITLPMFWVKLLFPILVAAVALSAAMRLGRPGMKIGQEPKALALLLACIWILAAISLTGMAPAERRELIFGETWIFCLVFVPLLSIPVFAAAVWAMRGLAPTKLRLAGSAAGLLAGASSAAVYALYCPELEASFIALWYVLGMFIPALIGGVAGPRLLNW